MPPHGRRSTFLALASVGALMACDDGGGAAPRSLQFDTGPALDDLAAAPSTANPRSSVAPAPSSVTAATSAPSSSAPTTPLPVDPVTLPPTTVLPTTAPAPTPQARTFSVLVTGDLLSHIPVVRQANANAGGAGYEFAPMFEAVRPTIEAADVAICHLETPVAPPGTEPDPTPPDYGVPAEIAAGIRSAGFDRCSLASNHSMDKGAAGIDATLNALDAVGVGHAGMARTPAEAAPSMFDVQGVTVAHLSYTYGFNGMPIANDEPWRSNRIDPDRIVAEAQQARAQGAEFVLLSLHWGTEGATDVTPEQRRWAEQITASGAVDLIVGHHAHVVQPIEQVNGRWVVFGLGNFLSAMSESTDCCGIRGQDGMMVRVEVAEQPDGSFAAGTPQVIPTYVDRSAYVILPVQAGLADPAFAGTVGTGALQASLERTRSVVGDLIQGG